VSTGWTTIKPPHEWVNWWWNLVYQWIVYLLVTGGRRYDSLHDALAALAVDDHALVVEDDLDQAPGSEAVSPTHGVGSSVDFVAADGDVVVWLHTDLSAQATTRSFTGSALAVGDVLATYMVSGAGTARAVCLAGDYVAIAYGNLVDVFDKAAGGAPLYTVDHGAAVRDVCTDGTNLYLVGVSGTGTITARARTLATGAVVWDTDHGATLYSCCTDGRRVYVGGALSAGVSMRAYEAGSGTVAWSYTPADATQLHTTGHQLAVRDGVIYAGYPGSATLALIAYAAGDPTIELGSANLGVQIDYVTVDQDYLLVGRTPFVGIDLYLFDRMQYPAMRVSLDIDVTAPIVSDGAAFFTGNGSEYRRLYRGNRPMRVSRVDPATARYRDDTLVYVLER